MTTGRPDREIHSDVNEEIVELVVNGRRDGIKNLAAYVGQKLLENPDLAPYANRDELPKTRTLQRAVRDIVLNIEKQEPGQRKQDEPFDWSDVLDGLDMAATPYLLEMWRLVAYEGLIFSKGDWTPSDLPPTNRQARWWWRVHQAVPEVSMYDVFWLSQRFVQRELFDSFLRPKDMPDMADLVAHLSYRPWEGWPDDASPEAKARMISYLKAIEDGRFPALRPGHKNLNDIIRVGDKATRLEAAPPMYDYYSSAWLLHSQMT